MTNLEDYGFVKSGNFYLENGKVDFDLNANSSKEAVYVITSDGVPMYIGKTNKTLKTRITGYKNPHESQKTNEKIKEKITEKLESGSEVGIWSLSPNQISYRGLELDMVRALENPLIQKFDPEWNGR
ncbi:MAG: hypothetical protein ABEJ95_01615 [Candidatus Nanohalobium sp.]